MSGFRFIDLFAGIGGFHHAMASLGGECVFASEIDPVAARVYERNWGLRPAGDIVPLTEQKLAVPAHDVLCAGFPCQPFSKSGLQRGMAETRGTLFWNICRVLEERRPSFVLLENVRNLVGPRHRDTWATIVETLRGLHYYVADEPVIASPHWLPPWEGGTPQVRERVFIPAVYVGPDWTEQPERAPLVKGPPAGWDPMAWDLETDLPLEEDQQIAGLEAYVLSDDEERWIDIWDDFLSSLDTAKLPGFPIWADAFVESPQIPPDMPAWKAEFLRKNSAFYVEHRATIDLWLGRHRGLRDLPTSRRKLEWQAQDAPRSLRNCVLQFRPSGIRVKRPTYVPALVAITQTSVFGPRGRRLTPREAARLQGFPEWFSFEGQSDAATYRQLGNAVAAGVVMHVVREVSRAWGHLLPANLRHLGVGEGIQRAA